MLRRAEDSVLRLCDEVGDAAVLRAGVIEVLQRAIGFDAFVWILTDPVSTVGAAPYAAVPAPEALPEVIRCKYLTAEHRWTALVGAARLSDLGQDEARPWRELLGRHGVVDVASVVHSDKHGTWAFLDLWRGGNVFTADEMDLLDRTRAPLTAALRRCQATTMSDLPHREVAEVEPVVLLVDDLLRVVGDTQAAATWLARLLPPSPGQGPVPAVVYNVAAQLVAREAGVDSHPAYARVHLGSGQWISVRAARLQGSDRRDLIAVSLQETAPLERLQVFTRAFGLSDRETKLVGLLAGGLDTHALAERMSLSPHTVQDHLKSVFNRTGTRSRPVLLSRALGVTP